MVLVLYVERDPVQTRGPDFEKLSQRLRRLGQEMRTLSQSQPDFWVRLEGLRMELNSVADRLRGLNSI